MPSVTSAIASAMLRKYAVTPLSPHDYTPVGDITVLGLTLLIFILLLQVYSHRNKSFHHVLNMLVMIVIATTTNLFCQLMLDSKNPIPILIYLTRDIHHLSLSWALYVYMRYLHEPLWIKETLKRRHFIRVVILIAAVFIVDTLGTVFRFGFYIGEDNTIYTHFNFYLIVYAFMTFSIFYVIIRYRSRVIHPIFWGLLGSNTVTVTILLLQGFRSQTSYTDVAYFFPVLGIIFMFHSNPYDIETGGVSENYFYDEINECIEKKHTMVLMSCNMMNFLAALRENNDLKLEYYQFFRQNVQRGVLYRFSDGRLILAFPKRFDTAQDRDIERMLEDFSASYNKFNIDYKIVIVETSQDVTRSADYIRLIEFAESTMASNTIYRIGEEDIQRFYKSSYILSELEDIASRRDLDDERVLVYCQPVFNINTGTYDTAEALMRLRLERTGMVFPDQFITLAEQHNLIHTMSLIILNKTCGAIRTLMEDGYEINRISVNFSTVDLRYESFCKEVQQIIARNQIPFGKIAIEITESRSEADFNIMKQKVTQLQELGIKFYLDDFGTGYSNFERIMEIPFDIIKFDRSMLIESGKSEASFYMVSTFANMFDKLHYSVLFEGIENEHDERSCVRMNAKYLQGFKYSRPIPIEQLCDFLQKSIA